jgi:RHS repeat-associated protein
VTAGSGSQVTEYEFAGQQTDPTGLQYLRARYYDPTTGRFLSRDPFFGIPALPQSLDRYGYSTSVESPGCDLGAIGLGAAAVAAIASPPEGWIAIGATVISFGAGGWAEAVYGGC